MNSKLTLTTSHKSDNALFLQMTEGSDMAMKDLFNKYYKRLCQFGLLFDKNKAVVEERVADVFIQLWNNRKNLNKIENPKVYLFTSARNSIIKSSKSDWIRQCIEIENKETPLDLILPSIEEKIIQKEQQEKDKNIINQILDQIPKKSRFIFELSRVNGLKYKEISELLNISIKTVESHISIAMKMIRRHVNNNS